MEKEQIYIKMDNNQWLDRHKALWTENHNVDVVFLVLSNKSFDLHDLCAPIKWSKLFFCGLKTKHKLEEEH